MASCFHQVEQQLCGREALFSELGTAVARALSVDAVCLVFVAHHKQSGSA